MNYTAFYAECPYFVTFYEPVNFDGVVKIVQSERTAGRSIRMPSWFWEGCRAARKDARIGAG